MSEFVPPSTGWVDDPSEVEGVMAAISLAGEDPVFATAASGLMVGDDDAPVFFWEAEKLVAGSVLPSWNQGSVGSCVSFGYGRAAQDLMFLEIARGEQEQWPGKQVATEPIYGGSRVEVGGGRIGGDGSVGAWAARWVKDWGIILRGRYGSYDLESYNESRCREYGRNGVPSELEALAREHPVTLVALVQSGEELWAAVGGWKPVPVCSNRGFTTTLRQGFCEPSGSWAHCMEYRGRFISPTRGKCFVIQNSWGGYLSGDRWVEVEGRGRVELPEGCFATTMDVADSMMKAKDSFALAGFSGWKRDRLDHTP